MGDAGDEDEPTDPEVAAFYEREFRKYRVLAISFIALGVLLLIAGAAGIVFGRPLRLALFGGTSAIGVGVGIYLTFRSPTRGPHR